MAGLRGGRQGTDLPADGAGAPGGAGPHGRHWSRRLDGPTQDRGGAGRSRWFRELELPFANGIGTARSLARLYAASAGAVDGFRLLHEETIADAIRRQSTGDADLVTGGAREYGTGFMLTPSLYAGTGPRAYGHDGAGGPLGLADPDLELGFGFLPNKLLMTGGSPWERAGRLVDAAYACARGLARAACP